MNEIAPVQTPINLELIKALRMLIGQAERGEIYYGIFVGTGQIGTEAMILEPGPAEPALVLAMEVAKAKIVSAVAQRQGTPRSFSPILRPRN